MRTLFLALVGLWISSPLSAIDSAEFAFLVKNKAGHLQDLSRSAFYQTNDGDGFQFRVSMPAQGKSYIFHLPAEGGVKFLGPQKRQMTFPGPQQWFTLDQQPGIEEFFMVFSAAPVPALEALVPAPHRALELLTWIKEYRGQASRLTGQSRSALAAVAGHVRAPEGAGIEIPLQGLYAFSIVLGR